MLSLLLNISRILKSLSDYFGFLTLYCLNPLTWFGLIVSLLRYVLHLHNHEMFWPIICKYFQFNKPKKRKSKNEVEHIWTSKNDWIGSIQPFLEVGVDNLRYAVISHYGNGVPAMFISFLEVYLMCLLILVVAKWGTILCKKHRKKI